MPSRASASPCGSPRAPGEPQQRVVAGGNGEGSVGEVQQGGPDRDALCLVAVQQRRVGDVAAGKGELPAQIDRVLDAGVHALGARWAVDVGGVAGQEDAAGAVAAGAVGLAPAPVDAEVARPDRVVQPQAAGGAAVGDALELVERHRGVGVGGWPHRQQPPRGGGAEREEEQHGLAEVGVGPAGLQPVDLQVGEQEGLRVGGAFEGDAGLLRVAAIDQLPRHAVTGEDLERSWLDGQGAGLVDTVGLTVDEPEPDAEGAHHGDSPWTR
jgi:hypothetical protein